MSEKTLYTKEGALMWQGQHDGAGLLHGISLWFYPGGQKLQEATYLHGRLHGQVVRYTPQQRVIEQVLYCNGLKEGLHQHFYSSGQLKSQVSFVAGILSGDVLLYYSGELLKRRLRYLNGKRDGIDTAWGVDGTILFCEEWEQGVKVRDIAEDSIYLYVNRI